MRLTAAEKHSVAALERLAKTWPKSLTLFARAGNMVVLKPGRGRTYDEAEVAHIRGIDCDGGDPQGWDVA